jgi:hypothetical protein
MNEQSFTAATLRGRSLPLPERERCESLFAAFAAHFFGRLKRATHVGTLRFAEKRAPVVVG